MKRCRFYKAYQGIYTPICKCDACWTKHIDKRVAILRAQIDIKAQKLYDECVEIRELREAEATMYKYPNPSPSECTDDNHIVVHSSFGKYCQWCGTNLEEET